MWCDSAPSCQWQVLDGSGGLNGRVVGDVGAECIGATVWDDELYVVYRYDDFMGSRHVMRVAMLKAGVWTFNTVDGHGFNGHGTIGNDVGGCPSIATKDPWVFIGFNELGTSAFRIGWTNRLSWDFQTMDGQGGTNGRVTAPLTRYATLHTANNGVLNAFYGKTIGELRRGQFTGVGADWTFQTINSGASALTAQPFVLEHAQLLYVFYRDGSVLRSEVAGYPSVVIDGDGQAGRGSNDVGQFGGGAVSATNGHAFYFDATAGDLRHVLIRNTTLSVETLDGDFSSPDGRIAGDTGRNASALRTTTGVAAVYEGPAQSVRIVLITE